jgi:rhamnogalacturonyl hydrolase YesR
MIKAGLTTSENYQTLHSYLQQLAAGLAAKQDSNTGCWYQLLNHDDSYVATSYDSSFCYTTSPVANYLESSCTAIFIAAYLKGMRLGLFDTDYTDLAKKAYRGFVENFMVADGMGGVHLVRCCKSAGLAGFAFRDGSANYYLIGQDTEPTSTSGSNFYTEGKVLGGFIMAATEYERLKEKETGIIPIRKQDHAPQSVLAPTTLMPTIVITSVWLVLRMCGWTTVTSRMVLMAISTLSKDLTASVSVGPASVTL